MAVTAETSRVSYTGNNSTVTSYSVPFLFLQNNDLAAIAKVNSTGVESVVTLANHTGAGNPAGGTVTTAAAVPATSTLTIYRIVPFTQTTSYAEGGDFPAASHERALDKLTMLAQQTSRQISSCLRGSEGVTSNPVTTVPNSMIGLDNNNAFKAMTLAEVKSYLSLSGVTLSTGFGIKTFADSGERAIAVPEFAGQLGTQRDTQDIYISTSTSAGAWSIVDENITLADIGAAMFTADGTGRGKFANLFVTTALIDDLAVTDGKLAATLDLSAKTLTMPANHWRALAPAGAVLNVVRTDFTTGLTLNPAGSVPADGTVPQNTEGTELITLSITPSAAANQIALFVSIFTGDGTNTITVAAFRDSVASSIWAFREGVNSLGGNINGSYIDSPNTTSAVTYKIRVGSASTTYINGNFGFAKLYGSATRCHLTAMEIKG